MELTPPSNFFLLKHDNVTYQSISGLCIILSTVCEIPAVLVSGSALRLVMLCS